jgi:hypothetical protein
MKPSDWIALVLAPALLGAVIGSIGMLAYRGIRERDWVALVCSVAMALGTAMLILNAAGK